MGKNQRLFGILISILSALSFSIPAGVLLFFRSAETRRLAFEIYGISSFSLCGPWILIGGVPIALLTYIMISRENVKPLRKGIIASLILLGAAFASLLNYPPPPHLYVLGCGAIYAAMIGLVTGCYYHDFNLRTHDEEINYVARVERIKLEYETWFRSLLAILAVGAAVSGTLVFRAFDYGKTMFSIRGEVTKDVLMAAMDSQTVMYIAAFYFGLLVAVLIIIMVKKITELSDDLHKIRPEKPKHKSI